MVVLFPKGEFLRELFEWVLLFLPRFYFLHGLEILNPYDLCLYCGGWVGGGGGAYFVKKSIFLFSSPVF